MKAKGSLLGALAIAGALLAGVAMDAARAQPFGAAHGPSTVGFVQVRNEGRGAERGGGRDEGRGGYRGQSYAPAPRGYAYPAPGYRSPQPAPRAYAAPQRYAPAQGYAPPSAYAPPRAYAPPQGYGAPQGYGRPQEYAPPQNYGREYAPPQAYGRPQGYAPPRAYNYAPAPNSLGSGWRPQQPEARRQGNVRLGSVIQNIRRSTPGRMLDAGVEPGPDGRATYRVRWAAAGGRRIDFIVDAATGAIIGQSGY